MGCAGAYRVTTLGHVTSAFSRRPAEEIYAGRCRALERASFRRFAWVKLACPHICALPTAKMSIVFPWPIEPRMNRKPFDIKYLSDHRHQRMSVSVVTSPRFEPISDCLALELTPTANFRRPRGLHCERDRCRHRRDGAPMRRSFHQPPSERPPMCGGSGSASRSRRWRHLQGVAN